MKKQVGTNNKTKTISKTGWIWISGIAFLLSFLAAGVLILFGRQLADLGIDRNIYYVILIPLGLSCAAFLAGAMRSYASFKSNGNIPYGQINLTGPAVIFFMVVVGGFIMPNYGESEQFDLRIRLLSNDKVLDSLDDGTLSVYLGDFRGREVVHDGEVRFSNIPKSYQNKKLKLQLVSEQYELKNPKVEYIAVDDRYVDVECIRIKKEYSTTVRGTLVDWKNSSISNARLDFNSGLRVAKTDPNGNFSLPLPYAPGEKVRLRVFINNDLKFNENITISSETPLDIMIR